MTKLSPLLALLVALPLAAAAETPLVQAEVRPGWWTEANTQMAGLHLTLAPGWKTYWRAPGDAGIPPSFDWSGSDNVRSVRIHWPRPEVFQFNGLTTIGYKGDVVLPVEITPRDAGRPVTLRGSIDLGICREICVPAALRINARVAPGDADPLIRAALADQPESGAEAGLAAISCSVEPISDGLRIEARMALPATGGRETVVFEPGQPGVWTDEAKVSRKGGDLVAVTEMVHPSGQPFALDRGAMTVTVLGSDRAVEVRGCPAP